MVERAKPQDLGINDPICPVCLEPIKATDKVRGIRDDLMQHPGRIPELTMVASPRERWAVVLTAALGFLQLREPPPGAAPLRRWLDS